MSSSSVVRPLHQPDGAGMRKVFVRDLVLDAMIGVHRHEHDGPQRVRINIDLAVPEADQTVQDRLPDVVCYEEITTAIRDIVGAGHINLVETLAEKIAARCLADNRIHSVRVRVEKLDVFADASSVGIEIERVRTV
jgi:7,8-dihydroneopterin aldolase/epimerase/oxygenase